MTGLLPGDVVLCRLSGDAAEAVLQRLVSLLEERQVVATPVKQPDGSWLLVTSRNATEECALDVAQHFTDGVLVGMELQVELEPAITVVEE